MFHVWCPGAGPGREEQTTRETVGAERGEVLAGGKRARQTVRRIEATNALANGARA